VNIVDRLNALTARNLQLLSLLNRTEERQTHRLMEAIESVAAVTRDNSAIIRALEGAIQGRQSFE
jgi:hypothetical protein